MMNQPLFHWYTIPEFAGVRPVNVYHKENASAPENVGSLTPEGSFAQEGPLTPEVSLTEKNVHVLARSVLLHEGQGRRRLLLTADDYYKLYINGQFVCQGPAPAWPEHYYYNEIDITPYLKDGRNVLALHLYYQGLINRVWNSGDGRFGAAALVLDEEEKCWEPQWRYHRSLAFSGETIGYETQYLEDFDSNLWADDWNMPDFDDGGWPLMVPAKWADYVMEKEPVRLVQVEVLEPAQIQKERGCWRIDLGAEVVGALRIRAKGRAGQETAAGQEPVAGRETAAGQEPVAGQETAAGRETVAGRGAAASQETAAGHVRIFCGEELSADGRVRSDMRCGCRYEETWTLREGENLLEPYDYKGFRYGELHFEEGVEILEVKAVVRHYPMDEGACEIASSDRRLEEIFAICKNGVRWGTQEGYLDCPTREKGQYLGDAVVTSRAQLWLSGTAELLEKCVKQFAWTSRVCPGLMAVAPGAFMQEIGDFSLLWSQMLLSVYEFTGNRDFLREYYPVARGILEHFRQWEGEDGLLVQVKDKWNLVDWPENLRDDYDFPLTRPVVAYGRHNVINALYAGAAAVLSCIEEILGLPASRDAGALKAAYIRTFYLPEKGLFRDSEFSSHTALHSNLYALYFDLCPEEARENVAAFLAEKGLCCGVLTSYFLLRALAGAGHYEDVYRLMVNDSSHGWVNMLREGATTCWEAWGKDQKWNTSLCHPWASGPIPVLIEEIAGFHPDPEAPEGFRFEPHIPEEVEEFRIHFPFRGKAYVVEKEGRTAVLRRENTGEEGQ